MADNFKDIEESFLGARDYANDLAQALSIAGKNTKAANEFAAKLSNELKGQTDLASQISTLESERSNYISENVKKGRILNKGLLAQLDNELEILKTKEKVQEEVDKTKKLEEERQDLLEKQSDELKEALGYSSELADLFAAGGVMALGAKAFTSAIENVKKSMTAAYDSALSTYKTLGVTANEAARLGAEVNNASMFSLTVDAQEAATAASALSDQLNTTRGITSSLIKDVAEISALTGDSASGAQLGLIFEQASGDAGALTDEIKDIAQGVGVNASVVMKEMADRQAELLTMSEEEIKVLAKKTAELAKQGLSMKMMEGMADNMLNIEGSMQAEMKARAFGMGDLLSQTNEMRAAAAELQFGDAEKGAQMMADALKESGITLDTLPKGRKQQEMLAQAYGMTTDQLKDMLVTQKENADLQEKYGETGSEIYGFISNGLSTVAGGAKTAAVEFGKLIAQYGVMNMMQGKGFLPGGGGKLGKTKLGSKLFSKAGDQTQQLSEGANVKTKGGGPGGFLKSLGEGLESMGKGAGKKLMGAAVLAATVALVGGGFALAMTILGDVDPMKMIAFSLSMGILGATLALMGSISGNVIMGALALGIVAVALIPAAFAFSLLADVDTQKMMAFSIALPLLALAAAGLGFLSPFIIAGAFAIAVLGASLIPAAVAFGMLGDANMEGIADKLANLGQVAGPLMTVGAGLVSIAAGLGLISAAGLLAIPALGMLIGLAAVAPALTTLANAFGLGGGDSSESSSGGGSSDGSLIEEVKGLRADLQSQPIQIVIDNKVISEITRIQSVKGSRKKY